MSILGFDEREIGAALNGILPLGASMADLDVVQQRDAVARMAWSGILEPGDSTAGALIGAFGPAEALELVLRRQEHAVLAAQDAGWAAETDTERWAQALSRWEPRLSSRRALASAQHAAHLGVIMVTPELSALVEERGQGRRAESGEDEADHGARPAPLWPEGLGGLGAHAPAALWIRGRTDALRALRGSLALVGARAATGYGERVAADAGAGLAERGVTVVSGGAYGIDGMAHRSCLASGGVTVAFLAGGVDRLYPSGHEELLRRIMERGAVIAELPCGQSPTRWRFLQRNRLIAAVSDATVVVEAGRRSGSLNTAGHAVALGRPLGAVPGPVTSPASEGCHRLIRDYGAACVTDAAEMAELVRPLDTADERGGAGEGEDPRTIRVVDALSRRRTRSSAEVAAESGLAVHEVQEVLAILQLEGRASARSGGWLRAG